MIAMTYDHLGPRRGAPKPPDDLMAELMAAGKTHDQLRQQIAAARYKAWAKDHGWDETTHRAGPPDKAWE